MTATAYRTIEPVRLVETRPEEDHPACSAGLAIALSPMARRVAANKAVGLRVGGDRPDGSDGSEEGS